ncbi:MAG: SpaH/EbpB family LPXTG-anchored major pilin [Peptococcaceae bacterium]|nr:SpaH/EbpB family LPXTG-anchored major pilin [Peptococcaceae bacterium]
MFKTKKAISVLLTLVLVLSMSVTTLWAAPGDVVDPTAPVSLTVHKYLSEVPSTTFGDGLTPPSIPNLAPAPGVTFTLTELVNVTQDTTIDNCQKGTFKLEGTTNGAGEIVWSTAQNALKQGFYILEETYSPYNGTVSASNPNGKIAAKAAPSIVTLPFGMLGTNGTEYNYNVHVYPKNVTDDNYKKTVVSGADVYKPGDAVEWQIETPISSQDTKAYKVTDQLDSRLTYQSASVKMLIPNSSSPSAAMSEGSDYTLTHVNGLVTVTLTSDGLAKAKENKVIFIQINIQTKVNDTAFQAGDNDAIVNGAQLSFTNDGSSEEQKIDIPTPATITLSNLEILKTDKKGDVLADAQFKIAATEGNALAGTFMKDSQGNELILTTDAQGRASASGMPFSEVNADGSINVYLVEIKAPNGYELPQVSSIGGGTQPVIYKVVMEKGTSVTITASSGQQITYNPFSGGMTIKNLKPGEGGLRLPVTGGTGTIIFTLIGLALIVSATLIFVKTRRASSK